jgi:hypothetical protein
MDGVRNTLLALAWLMRYTSGIIVIHESGP